MRGLRGAWQASRDMTANRDTPRIRRPRTPGAILAVAALVLLVLVATLALTQPTPDGGNTITAQLAQFFNKRFEFYGRKLNVMPDSGYQGSGDPAVQRSDAVAADAQNVFASLYYRTSDGLPYRQELARRRV